VEEIGSNNKNNNMVEMLLLYGAKNIAKRLIICGAEGK